MKLRSVIRDGQKGYTFYCPGCKYHHVYMVEGDLKWEFNGDIENPTFNPSLLVNDSRPEMRCHLFVREGKIHFCGDCFHDLKGKVVDLPELDPETGYPPKENR